jgi:hypothetical protein
MGVPATNVVDAVVRSMGATRANIREISYPNPAIMSRRSAGDYGSYLSSS